MRIELLNSLKLGLAAQSNLKICFQSMCNVEQNLLDNMLICFTPRLSGFNNYNTAIFNKLIHNFMVKQIFYISH